MKNKSERLYEILGQVDDDIVERTDPEKVGKTKKSSNLKWLSIAACFVLVTVIGVVVWKAGLPESSPIVDDNTVETDLKTSELTDDQSNEKTTDPQDTTTSDTIEPPFPEQAGSESDDVTSETNDSNTADTTENTYSANGGTSGICTVHAESYHSFPYELTEYVGSEKFDAWNEADNIASIGYDDRGCMWKGDIFDFIHEFDIPKDVFIKWYNETNSYYVYDYDIDLLYEGTAEENEEYYRNHEDRQENIMRPRSCFSTIKSVAYNRNKDAIINKYGKDRYITTMSLIDIIYTCNIPREDFEALTKEADQKLYGAPQYDYNLDLVYNEREYVEQLMKEHSIFYMDLLFCGEEPREQAYPEK